MFLSNIIKTCACIHAIFGPVFLTNFPSRSLVDVCYLGLPKKTAFSCMKYKESVLVSICGARKNSAAQDP